MVLEITTFNLLSVHMSGFTSLSEYLVFIYPSIQPPLPCFSSGATMSKRCFPSRRETDVNTGTKEVDFQAAQFVSFQKSILFSPLPPPLSLSSSPPFASPLSSLTQVGEKSGTSRRRSGRLYTGAKYPLLYWRMGRHKKRSGTKGVGEDGQRLVDSGHKINNNQFFEYI